MEWFMDVHVWLVGWLLGWMRIIQSADMWKQEQALCLATSASLPWVVWSSQQAVWEKKFVTTADSDSNDLLSEMSRYVKTILKKPKKNNWESWRTESYVRPQNMINNYHPVWPWGSWSDSGTAQRDSCWEQSIDAQLQDVKGICQFRNVQIDLRLKGDKNGSPPPQTYFAHHVLRGHVAIIQLFVEQLLSLQRSSVQVVSILEVGMTIIRSNPRGKMLPTLGNQTLSCFEDNLELLSCLCHLRKISRKTNHR